MKVLLKKTKGNNVYKKIGFLIISHIAFFVIGYVCSILASRGTIDNYKRSIDTARNDLQRARELQSQTYLAVGSLTKELSNANRKLEATQRRVIVLEKRVDNSITGIDSSTGQLNELSNGINSSIGTTQKIGCDIEIMRAVIRGIQTQNSITN